MKRQKASRRQLLINLLKDSTVKLSAILCLLLLGLFLTFEIPVRAQESEFLVRPYIQLGDNPCLSSPEKLELVWFSRDRRGPWSVVIDQGKQKELKVSSSYPAGTITDTPFFRYTAKLEGLIAGQPFNWHVKKKGRLLCSGRGTARKSKDQNYSFAVFADIGTGSAGQKKVAYQCYKSKPDFLVLPGDIVYSRGRVSEYLNRFFPILNNDKASPESGAPLLSSTVTVAALGNHDIANASPVKGVDLTAFPDALAYFIFFSQPLNGPNRLPNTRNSPPITGEAENQLNFVKSAGNRFPVMANFSFDYGNSHWLFLDGNAYMDWSNKRMRDFVKSDLKASRQLFKFVCYHQPSFSVDRAHFKEQRMRLLCDIFEKEGVTAVFSGHAHNYQRSYPLKFKVKRKNGLPLEKADGIVNGELNLDHEFDGIKNKQPRGVIYIVSGAGGAPLYSRIEKTPGQKSFTSVFSGNLHSYTFCTVNGKVLKISQISEDGEEIDSFSIEK